MPTIQESLDALVTQTTGLTNTVSGRITDMDGKITQANSAQVAAETAKTNAEIAETSAQTAQSLAETARDVASTAKVDAQTAKSDALAAQSAASAAQTSAEAARDASIAADVSASTNRSDSITAKNASVVAQGLSETAEVNASTSAAAANSHKTKAGQWADNAEDASVETGKYSAKHWSAKAAIENAAAGVSENNALASKNAASASEGVATTKASESSTSATASAASASTATTKASEAVGSANTAATQAGISTTKASEASSSASAAASSASSAASAATTAVNAVIDTAPANLNTLNELAAALGDDANYASTTTTALGNRYTKAETDGKIVELSPPATKSHVDSLGINAATLTGSLPAISGANLTGIEAVIKQTTKPTGQSVGTLWFDIDDKILHIHDGTDFVPVYEPPNNGTSELPFTSAWESKQLGAANGNYYVMINGTKRHVYINNSDYDGAWILVTRAKSNSNAHHGGGGYGGNSSPINPSSSSAHDYSDSFINEIFAARAYNGSNSGCTWRAYANNRGNMFGYATSANFCSDCQADGSGWDLVNGSYSSSYNVNLGGNNGSRGFGDHHANGSFFAYNRHNSNSGFAHDNMSNSDGVFYIRN